MVIDKLKLEADRRLREGASRIDTCLSIISRYELWQKPGQQLASIGNLVNHLCGNISQWVLKGLGGEEYVRHRNKEFTEVTGELPSNLADKLRECVDRACAVVAGLTEPDLEREYTVQGYQETGVGILVHVVEHLSYHVGQITFYVKLIKGVDIGYYRGVDLDIP
jgi:uncharacterized damage-inducible protein DinB